MKLKFHCACLGLVTMCFTAQCQGTFVYDQQSSSDETPIGGNGTIQNLQNPYGQSFTPTLPGIGFIKLQFADPNVGNGLGAILYVNLRANSVSGTILSSTVPLSFADGFVGIGLFVFPSTVDLTPGTTYFVEPVVQSGDQWNINAGEYNYPGGSAFFGGLPVTASDYWFREGIVVPEPGTWALLLLGLGALAWRRGFAR